MDRSIHSEPPGTSWDLEITPRSHALDLQLGEVWRYRDLLWLFVRRDFVAQYKQTILGPLWHLIQPLMTTAVFLLVFGYIADVSTDGIEPAFLFYMAGLTLWTYFAVCVTSTANTFVTNSGIFGKVYFPRLVLPLSVIISNAIRLGIQLALLFGLMLYFHLNGSELSVSLWWLAIPILVIITGAIALAAGITISAVTTKYRDAAVLVAFGVQLGLYLTPVAYPMSAIGDRRIAWMIAANPLSPVVEAFRYVLFGKGTLSLTGLAYSASFAVVLLLAGAILFNRTEKTFMDTV